MHIPDGTFDPFTAADAGLHVLSYGRAVTASSVLDEKHAPEMAADENMCTWWSAASGNPGEWLQMDLGKAYEVSALQVNFADQDIERFHGRKNGFSYKYTVEASLDGENWFMLIDRRANDDDPCHEYFPLDEEVTFRYIRLTNFGEVPAKGKFAVSGLRVFGVGEGNAPEKAPEFTAERWDDTTIMTVKWDAVPGAEGYIVRFGVNPDELHTHWQAIGECEAVVRCLNCGVEYYITVDAYNENGIVRGTKMVKV